MTASTGRGTGQTAQTYVFTFCPISSTRRRHGLRGPTRIKEKARGACPRCSAPDAPCAIHGSRWPFPPLQHPLPQRPPPWSWRQARRTYSTPYIHARPHPGRLPPDVPARQLVNPREASRPGCLLFIDAPCLKTSAPSVGSWPGRLCPVSCPPPRPCPALFPNAGLLRRGGGRLGH